MESVISTGCTRIACERSGNGPPLVLVHGTTADQARWANILPEIGRDFTVLAADRRGRGSSGDTDTYSLAQEFDDVARVVEAAGPGANLLGFSFRALCAMQAALRVKNWKRMMLYEPAFHIVGQNLCQPGMVERLRVILDAGDREKPLARFFTEAAGVTDAQIPALRADPLWPARVAAAHTLLCEMADEDYEFQAERFRRLDVPTRLLRRENGRDVLIAATRAVGAARPASRIVVLKGQGHIADTTAADLFLREVTGFLAR